MRVVRYTDEELVISTFSRWTWAVVILLGTVTLTGFWYVLVTETKPALYAMIPLTLLWGGVCSRSSVNEQPCIFLHCYRRGYTEEPKLPVRKLSHI